MYEAMEHEATEWPRSCRRIRHILQEPVSRSQRGTVDYHYTKFVTNYPIHYPQPFKKELWIALGAVVCPGVTSAYLTMTLYHSVEQLH